jgi:RNase H-fold protein (predicted Holliday junction resolvase)
MKVVHKAGKKKQQKDKGLIDKISAAIILQDYLETLNNVRFK